MRFHPLRVARGVCESHGIRFDANIGRGGLQGHAVLTQLRQQAHAAHNGQACAKARRFVDYRNHTPTLEQKLSQFHTDQLTADDDNMLSQRHPGVGQLAHEVQIGA